LVAKHPAEAAEVKSGNQRIFGFFVGSAMKLTQGKGNPKLIQELLKKYLA
jgi:aspartyl-tRNA(Asn)/glutamyl-tRNA(Gln) amidotransferase subunit B